MRLVMKKFIYINLLYFSFGIVHAQQASDYFPEQPCVRWEYKVTTLDSLNNEIDSSYFYKHDLFVTESNFEGKLAKIVQTKSGPAETINFQPYLDSSFYYFSESNGDEYFNVGLVGILLSILDSVLNNQNFSFVEFFNSFEEWYTVYRFAHPLYDEYTILQLDTTASIDSLILPLRFEVRGKRLPDELLSTPVGDLNCKKFVRKIGFSYLIALPPPLPPIAIPILFLEDHIWIAEDYWIVQGVIPATNVDLSVINVNLPSFYIPGLITKIDTVVTYNCVNSVEEALSIPNEITLSQNYPNPFNPSTTIKFSIPVILSGVDGSLVTLKIYNALGKEVATLVNEDKPAGTYEVEWNANSVAGGLASGVYFYRLKTDSFVQTKKMILMK
jgi:hypothetical protein